MSNGDGKVWMCDMGHNCGVMVQTAPSRFGTLGWCMHCERDRTVSAWRPMRSVCETCMGTGLYARSTTAAPCRTCRGVARHLRGKD